MATMVTTAERLKPEKASCGVSTPVVPRLTRTSRATTSARTRLVRNRTMAAVRMISVMTALSERGMGYSSSAAGRSPWRSKLGRG